MPGPRFGLAQANQVLTQVYEGMKVYDKAGNEIGTVEYVYLGDLTEAADEYDQGEATLFVLGDHESSLIEEFARDVALSKRVPDTWRARLLRRGFLRINSIGLFAADRYAMPEQIASVSDDHVSLRVSCDELLKS
jgi:hypothetical protein